MLHCARIVAIVSILDNRIKELSKQLVEKIKHSVSHLIFGLYTQQHTANMNSNLVALLVSSYHAHSLDKGVSRVVHPGLDALVHGPLVGGGLVPQVSIDGGGQGCCHAVVVLPQVREISAIGIKKTTLTYCLDKKLYNLQNSFEVCNQRPITL